MNGEVGLLRGQLHSRTEIPQDSICQCHLQKVDLLEYEKALVFQLRPKPPSTPLPRRKLRKSGGTHITYLATTHLHGVGYRDLRCACWKRCLRTIVQKDRSLDTISRGVTQVLDK